MIREEGEAAFIINQHSFPVFVARGLAGIYYYSYSKEDIDNMQQDLQTEIDQLNYDISWNEYN